MSETEKAAQAAAEAAKAVAEAEAVEAKAAAKAKKKKAAAAKAAAKAKKTYVEVIQLKAPTNVSYRGPKGRMTGCVLPMSVYRGKMARRVYDLIEDKSLITVIE